MGKISREADTDLLPVFGFRTSMHGRHGPQVVIDATGRVVVLGEVRVDAPRRALLTVLDEPAVIPGEAALLAEPAPTAGWPRPEEDAAWSDLQPEK